MEHDARDTLHILFQDLGASYQVDYEGIPIRNRVREEHGVCFVGRQARKRKAAHGGLMEEGPRGQGTCSWLCHGPGLGAPHPGRPPAKEVATVATSSEDLSLVGKFQLRTLNAVYPEKTA